MVDPEAKTSSYQSSSVNKLLFVLWLSNQRARILQPINYCIDSLVTQVPKNFLPLLRLGDLERRAFPVQALLGSLVRLGTAIRQDLQLLLCEDLVSLGPPEIVLFKVHARQDSFEIVCFFAAFESLVLGVHTVEQAFELAFLDDEFLELALPVRLVQERLLDRAARREPVDDDGSRLADAVCAVHRLQVLLRVPV